MKDEIAVAAVFVTQLVKKNQMLNKEQLEMFQNQLTGVLVERFKDHWYKNVPSKGQGYRCIRINDTEPVDPVLKRAAVSSGLKYNELGLRNELTLWVDPSEVSCRLGENRGSFCTLALFRDGSSENYAKSVDLDKILARHEEMKQAQAVKFREATSTRWNQKDPSTRVSPPVASYEPHQVAYHTSWEAQNYDHQANGSNYGAGGYHDNLATWGHWRSSNNQHSPNSTPGVHASGSGSHSHNHHKQWPAEPNMSSHSNDRYRWNKTTLTKA